MQLLCIAALLLSAVAAHPRQDEKLRPTGGPKLDAHSKGGDNDTSVMHGPGRDSGHPVSMPAWLPNRPSRKPGHGNTSGPMKGSDGKDRQPGTLTQASTRGKRQVPSLKPDVPGIRHPEPAKHFERPKGPQQARPNGKNPVYSPVFKVDKVTFQNTTDVTLKKGENIFLMPMHGERGQEDKRGPQQNKGGNPAPPKNWQYVKLIYNTTEPNKVSFEYGFLKPMNLSGIAGE
ncbi:uncharacterized protein LOC119898998 [Micropterus salmoides]|uniref:uncharacterized protein LOC119898998 n=1 Tax=Micropterus salmoides TaxID=27706 RepID=UPI0018EA5E43|nr:uncharacterized protein LOC119898998 [Micropterus salmoides]